MYFNNFAEALVMEGHGIYVWSAYLIAFLVIAYILVTPWRRQRQFMQRKSAELKRQQGGPSTIKEGN